MNKIKDFAKSKIGRWSLFIFLLILPCLYFYLKTLTSDPPLENKFRYIATSKQFPFARKQSSSADGVGAKSFVSLSDQIDALSATHNPVDAFAAFQLVQDCIDFGKFGSIPFFGFPHPRDMTPEEKNDEVRLCGGITERIKTSRLDHLSYAAKNGVQGADFVFFVTGPFGDKSALETRPDDPLVKDWKKQAIAQLTENAVNGNYPSLTTLVREYETSSGVAETNPLMAFTYTAALRRIDDHIGIPSQYDDATLVQLQAKLSGAEIQAATAAAASIYANWLKNAQK